MNHTQIEFGGKNRSIRFGLKPLGDILQHTGMDIEAYMKSIETNPFTTIPVLLYYGAKWGEERNGNAPDFELADVYDWIEQDGEGFGSAKIEQVLQSFFRSLYENVPTIKQVIDTLPEESKKNLIGP